LPSVCKFLLDKSQLTETQVKFLFCKYYLAIYICIFGSKYHYELIKLTSNNFTLDYISAILYFNNIKFENFEVQLVDELISDAIAVLYPRYCLALVGAQSNFFNSVLNRLQNESLISQQCKNLIVFDNRNFNLDLTE
jgi:hypothetical protein